MFNPPNKTQANSLFQEEVQEVNRLSECFEVMSDEQLAGMTAWLRRRHERGETLDKLLPEAFATVREASSRVLGMRHFDEQIMGGVALHKGKMGGVALHKGKVAEMRGGEGKTLLVAPLAAYLNAIAGKGVHVIAVSDYLARRDSERLGRLYERLGMRVGCLQSGMDLAKRREAYKADVTYGSYSEFGFDYLRDNMIMRANQRVQRGHAFAIVDDADYILIDEARTPLIISGAGTKSANTYKDFARAVRGLTPDVDFEMDEAKHTIAATDEGLRKIERRLGIDDLYSDPSGQLANHLRQALRAQYLFHRDRQYMVVGGEVKIVDESTGRVMEGRRHSEGLHQAIEAKEGVCVREENQTLATIALQNYFRLYDKLSGVTGAATDVGAELKTTYDTAVVTIPTNRPVIRKDNSDLVYQSVDAKFAAVADDIVERHWRGQPVLVGTASIESSERLSRTLNKRGVPHEVLNAKFHKREAQIVAQAGREGAVTVATNMAGRGTDIILGGNPDELARDMLREKKGYFRPAKEGEEPGEPSEAEWGEARRAARKVCEAEREHVLRAGGLCVIGTERHESRRIDNQLRGRSGRRGDPGETQFYLSLEDDLMRLFGGDRMDRIAAMMARYDMPADTPIQSRLVTKAVEGAQRKVEEMNFAMRKQVLEYDDVMNEQRRVIYEERDRILDGKDIVGHINDVTHDVVRRKVEKLCPEGRDHRDWDLVGLRRWVEGLTGRDDLPRLGDGLDQADVIDQVDNFVSNCYSKKSDLFPDGVMRALSAQVMLRVIDTRWVAYLQEMDYLRTGIGLRGFGGDNPLIAYKDEAYAAFTELVNTMYEDFLRTILRFSPAPAEEAQASEPGGDSDRTSEAGRSDPAEAEGNSESGVVSARRAARWTDAAKAQAPDPAPSKPVAYRKADSSDSYANVGRNDPCPCGSGKKFKNCHGRNRGGGTR